MSDNSGKTQGMVILTIFVLSIVIGAVLFFTGFAWYWYALAFLPAAVIFAFLAWLVYEIFGSGHDSNILD